VSSLEQVPLMIKRALITEKSKLMVVLSSIMSTVLIGCSMVTATVPDDIKTLYPSNIPKGTSTNFGSALACMDDLLLRHKVDPVYISSQGLVNYTSDQTLSAGGIEMLITALSKLSIRSNSVRFVSYNSDIQNMMTLQGAHPNNSTFRVPDYFIRGGITQNNKSLFSGQVGSGASLEFEEPDIIDGGSFFTLRGQEDVSSSLSNSTSYGTLTLDLSVGFISNLQIVPGVAFANTLALENRTGEATSIDLTMGDIGYTYSFSKNLSYDFNTLYRSLIEVGVIQVMGKLQNVPYWRCLAGAGDVEERNTKILNHFLHLSAHDMGELLHGAQLVLSHLSYYKGPTNRQLTDEMQEALQDYQENMGLLATGQVDYATFHMMKLFTPSQETGSSNWWLPFPYTQSIPQIDCVKDCDASAQSEASG
jgi:hypothetical protein